jgi:hypothetical protein
VQLFNVLPHVEQSLETYFSCQQLHLRHHKERAIRNEAAREFEVILEK